MSRTKAEIPVRRGKASLRNSAALRAENERLRAEIADLALKNEELREQLSASPPKGPARVAMKAS
jgi:hypothetical protein